jgi:CheY-like chemotaxis protein
MLTRRVLVIDDQPDIHTLVKITLEELAGWRVMSATSGQEGLIKVLINQPDAILLDMMMPGMDGLAFLRALRNYPQGEALPVVLFTASVSFRLTNEWLALDVKGVIAKPFEPFVLAMKLAHFLDWELDTLG